MIPIAFANQDLGIFNIEIPYYNWYYPIIHADEISLSPIKQEALPLSFVRAAYVHFPFCTSLCSFCPYIRTAKHTAKMRQEYVDRLIEEIISHKQPVKQTLDCIFFGGGTPSLFTEDQFAGVMDALASVFDIPSGCEITVEVGARSFTRSIATTFQKCGVSNIRIGVQSFNASARRLFCLSAQVSDVAAAVEHARAANLAVSFDLLFGYHGQTIDDMITDLKVAHNLEPDTIETYSLNLLSAPQRYWDAVAVEGVPRVTARQRLEYYSAARSTLINLGYHQWSGHGFARSPTFDLLYHRCVYGSLGGYLGFGPGAVSLGPTLLKINHNDIERYLKSEPSKPHYCTFPISEQDHTRKRFISELPYYGSCEVGSTLDEEVGSRMKELEAAQIVIREDNTLVLADRAWPQYASIMYFLLPKRDRAALGLEMFEKLASLGNSFSKDMLWL